MLVQVFVPPDVTQPPRRVRGPTYPAHKKTSVREALLKLFQDRMQRGQTFRQLTRTALQPELQAIVRKLTGDDPAEIALNRAGERTSYCNVLRYIFENEFRKGGITTRPGARSSAGRGSPARGFAKILAKAESLDEPVENTDSNSLDDDIRDNDEWADTHDNADLRFANIPTKSESLDEPVDNTDSNTLDDDIRDDDEWATKDDADISPFQYPWKEYFIVDDNPDDDWNFDN